MAKHESQRSPGAEADWAAQSRRLTILAERGLNHGDEQAYEEIVGMFLDRIRRMARVAPARRMPDVAQALVLKLLMVVKENVHRADDLMAYCVGALRRALADELRKIFQESKAETSLYSLDGHALDFSQDPAMSEAERQASFEKCVQEIDGYIESAKLRRDRIGTLVGQVIRLRFLNDCLSGDPLTVVGACFALGLNDAETRTVAQRISRERINPRSSLYRLAAGAIDEPKASVRKSAKPSKQQPPLVNGDEDRNIERNEEN